MRWERRPESVCSSQMGLSDLQLFAGVFSMHENKQTKQAKRETKHWILFLLLENISRGVGGGKEKMINVFLLMLQTMNGFILLDLVCNHNFFTFLIVIEAHTKAKAFLRKAACLGSSVIDSHEEFPAGTQYASVPANSINW